MQQVATAAPARRWRKDCSACGPSAAALAPAATHRPGGQAGEQERLEGHAEVHGGLLLRPLALPGGFQAGVGETRHLQTRRRAAAPVGLLTPPQLHQLLLDDRLSYTLRRGGEICTISRRWAAGRALLRDGRRREGGRAPGGRLHDSLPLGCAGARDEAPEQNIARQTPCSRAAVLGSRSGGWRGWMRAHSNRKVKCVGREGEALTKDASLGQQPAQHATALCCALRRLSPYCQLKAHSQSIFNPYETDARAFALRIGQSHFRPATGGLQDGARGLAGLCLRMGQ